MEKSSDFNVDFTNIKDRNEAIEALVVLYHKENAAYVEYVYSLSASPNVEAEALCETWFTSNSAALGMSPKDYLAKMCGGEIGLKDATDVFDAFAKDSYWSIPDGVCQLLADFGEEGPGYVAEFLENTESLSKSFYECNEKESIMAQDILVSVFRSLSFFECERVRAAAWNAFDRCSVDNEAILECAADSICNVFGADDIAQHLAAAESIGFKELTLMQTIVNSMEKSDEYYRVLRKCVKMCAPGTEEKLVTLSIFADYGDPRAVTMLRATAKEMKASLAGKNSKDNQAAFQELYMVASMINKLGGNTEDIIGM